MSNNQRYSSRTRLSILGTCLLAVAAVTLGGCSKDSTTEDTTTTTTTTTADPAVSTTVDAAAAAAEAAAERVLFDKEIQAQLTVVGCYKGKDDGVIGPQTDEAIILFQTASGLTVDGELGPKTDAALTAAANSKKIVCTATTVTTKPPTTVPRNNPPCTAAAIGAAIAPNTVNSYICGNNFAAGSQKDAADPDNSAFLLAAGDDNSGQWVVISGLDEATCDALDIPPAVLAVSSCKVS